MILTKSVLETSIRIFWIIILCHLDKNVAKISVIGMGMMSQVWCGRKNV